MDAGSEILGVVKSFPWNAFILLIVSIITAIKKKSFGDAVDIVARCAKAGVNG